MELQALEAVLVALQALEAAQVVLKALEAEALGSVLVQVVSEEVGSVGLV